MNNKKRNDSISFQLTQCNNHKKVDDQKRYKTPHGLCQLKYNKLALILETQCNDYFRSQIKIHKTTIYAFYLISQF